MYRIRIVSTEDLSIAAESFIQAFNNERIFAFYGKMGAGKTTFIKALCHQLGSHDNITSPTFALINEYHAINETIYHFDFYRIKNLEEVFDMGYEDYIYSGEYCFIEWPERIEPLLPERLVKVVINENQDGSRTIEAKKV